MGRRTKGARTGDARLVLDLEHGVRSGLVSAFTRIVENARKIAVVGAPDPERAVHDWRKSLRRARSVVRFAQPILGAKGARPLLDVLAAAMRETSSLRDAHVLEATLEAVPKTDETATARAVLERSIQRARAKAGSPEYVLESLRRATAKLDGIESRFEAALRPQVRWEDVEESLRRSHKRVRKAWKGAKKTWEDEKVHEWRKRTKELRYELEMLSSSGGSWVEKQHKAFVRLAEALGEVTDLMVLCDYVRHWNKRARNDEAELLVRQVRRLVDRRLARALDRARPVLARRPRKFAAKTLRKVRPGSRAA